MTMLRVRAPGEHAAVTPSRDWRPQTSGPRRRLLRVWLLGGAALTFLILVVGGITRLTESGLSIVEWKPVTGVIPPLSDAEWRAAFDRYRAFPEYQKLRQGMTLAEFRGIFLWEYVHRLLARLVGVLFLVPCAYFWLRGYFTPALRRRVLGLFGLGALQGFMGWFMVSSGLVDDPRVSPYRLAAHLCIALAIIGSCLWLARDLRDAPPRRAGRAATLAAGVHLLGGLLLLQIVWGALVAGMDAGLIYNTFPRMGGHLLPPGAGDLQGALRDVVADPATVQWVHRVFGTLLAVAALAVLVRARRPVTDARTRRLATLFASLVLAQYLLGVVTLLLRVPAPLGALHQAAAVLLFATWVVWLHHARSPAAARG